MLLTHYAVEQFSTRKKLLLKERLIRQKLKKMMRRNRKKMQKSKKTKQEENLKHTIRPTSSQKTKSRQFKVQKNITKINLIPQTNEPRKQRRIERNGSILLKTRRLLSINFSWAVADEAVLLRALQQ